MPKPSVCRKNQLQPLLSTTMPVIIPPNPVKMEAETRKWERKATILYRQYLLALAATVVASAALLVLLALPLLAPIFGDAYLFGSPPV